jgi:DNA-binding MarR family transcriptional regulator
LKPTVGVLAERMQLQHHSTVELIDRLVDRGFLCRLRATDDRRRVLVKLTRDGEEFLKGLSLHHLQELQSAGPKFLKILQSLLDHKGAGRAPRDPEVAHISVRSKSRKESDHG